MNLIPVKRHHTRRVRWWAVFLALPSIAMAFSLPALVSNPAAPPKNQDECVILLHGLGRTSLSMLTMANAMEKDGYIVANIGYPSRSKPIEQLADEALPRGLTQCRDQGAKTTHIVTHSMGGILTRYYLQHNKVLDLGRVVMLGPPNQGSQLADQLMDEAYYQTINGPAGQQLGTGADGIAARMGPVNFELGVIAGKDATFVDEWLSESVDEPGDGKVTVAEARVEGMADFLIVPANHTFMLSDGDVIKQVKHFLQEGVFFNDPDLPL